MPLYQIVFLVYSVDLCLSAAAAAAALLKILVVMMMMMMIMMMMMMIAGGRDLASLHRVRLETCKGARSVSVWNGIFLFDSYLFRFLIYFY